MKLEPNLQKGGNDFLYVESKRARLEREKVSVLKISKHVSNVGKLFFPELWSFV